MRYPEVAGSKEGNSRIPPPAPQKTYTSAVRPRRKNFTVIPLLSTTSFYNFLSGTMIALFVLALAVIFVYEYEVLRRPKTQTQT